jgi:hypothetical protein
MTVGIATVKTREIVFSALVSSAGHWCLCARGRGVCARGTITAVASTGTIVWRSHVGDREAELAGVAVRDDGLAGCSELALARWVTLRREPRGCTLAPAGRAEIPMPSRGLLPV